MDIKPHPIFMVIICLLLVSVSAQDEAKKCPKPTTETKQLSATIRIQDQSPMKIVGEASFTLTAMNSDDSLAGIFNFALPDKERQKIAQAMRKNLNDIPAVISLKDVIAQFHKGTECPVLQLDFVAMEIEIAGEKVKLRRFTLNLKEADDSIMIYVCKVARLMNVPTGAKSPIRRVNERLNCLE